MVGACPFPVPQGSQVLIQDTARQVQRLGHEVHVVVYGYGVGDDPPDLTIHRCGSVPGEGKTKAGPSWVKSFQDAALVGTLRHVVREHSIDLVHAHNYEGLAVALVAGTRPVVYHAHNAMVDELPHYFGHLSPARGAGGMLDRLLPRRADHIIAPHQTLAAYLRARGCIDKVSVIPPAVDVGQFESTRAWGEAPSVLYAGNLDAYQNLPFLMNVMSRVRVQMPEAHLRIVSNAQASLPDWVSLVPADFASLRRALAEDVVVACPRTSWSGYPIKLLNAMAAGKAIVACAGSAHSLTDGVNGCVVANNDEEAFAEAVCGLLRDSAARRRLGEAALRTATEHYDPGQVAKQIDAVYSSVIHAKTS
jgi:glycosyltransferase involved in cell wall biosynthesis